MKLKIGSKIFDFFNNVTVDLKFDSIASSFTFEAIFDHTNNDHLELFKPFSYRNCQILSNNGDLLITGTILNNVFVKSSVPNLASFSGYSKTGVLEDCSIPSSLYPLQFDGMTLKEITQKIIKPFNLGLIIEGSAIEECNKILKIEKAGDSESIKSFLASLSSQKNIILTHDSKGNLVFTKGRLNDKPIAKFSTINGTSTNITVTTNGQGSHSEIHLQKQQGIEETNSGEEIIKNTLISSFRPITRIQTSGDDNDTSNVAKNALGSELKAITVKIETDRLEWVVAGKFETIKPNRIISVIAPECYIFKETNFFIESVSLSGDEKSETATITAVLPQVYTGEQPINPFRL